MQTVSLTFTDTTYTDSNLPSCPTLQSDLASIETAINANAETMTENSDSDVSGNSWVVDEDSMSSNLATKVPTQQSVKSYVDTHAADTSTHGVTTIAGLDEAQTLTNKKITVTAAPSTDEDYTGTTVSLTAGATIAVGDFVYIDTNGKASLADADAATTAPCIGVAVSAAEADATVSVLLHGIMRLDSWDWTAGSKLYLSTTAGDATHTAPTGTDDVIQVVGLATHPDRIFINPVLSFITHT